MNGASPALLGLAAAMLSGTPSWAQGAQAGCDIATSSYVVVAPPRHHADRGPVVALPQTPCATIPNGYEGVLQGITIDVDAGSDPQGTGDGSTPRRLR
jgi:hypothetical protein